MIREPVVSGQFYPADKQKLLATIEELAEDKSSKISAKAIIMPHAGYMCSGKVAAETVSRVMPRKRLVILGPNHHGTGSNFALWAKGKWRTPLGEAAIDEELAEKILSKGKLITEDYLAHKFEHSIEVELPFLQYFFKDFKFVPISCSAATLSDYRGAAEQLYEALKDIKEDVLLIASTDFTHYESDEAARTKDRRALESIIELDDEELIKRITKENITMCGFAAVAPLIGCVKRLGARKAQVALYQTSGDTVGDYSSVVGYGGIIIS